MRYLSLYLKSELIVWIDLHKPDSASVKDAIHYANVPGVFAIESNHKNVFTANFPRTAENQDPAKSRLIVWWEVPRRIGREQLLPMLEEMLKRGKDKRTRKMNPRSLANLRPSRPFSTDYRPTKPRKLTEAQLDQALELRSNGCSWPQVGDILGCNAQTVRSSLRRRGNEIPKLRQEIKPLTGQKTNGGYPPTSGACSS